MFDVIQSDGRILKTSELELPLMWHKNTSHADMKINVKYLLGIHVHGFII